MYPLLPFTIAFVSGIVAQSMGMGWWGIPILVAALIIAACLHRHIATNLLCGAVAGLTVALLSQPTSPPDGMLEDIHTYGGTVTEQRETDGSQSLTVRVDSCEGQAVTPFLVSLVIPGVLPEIEETDHIGFRCLLAPLADRRVLPDETDYAAMKRRKGIYAESFVSSDDITYIRPDGGLMARIRKSRHDIDRLLAYSDLSPEAAQFLSATLTGSRTAIDVGTRQLFSQAGLAHILALSGLHVGIITMMAGVALIPILFLGKRKLRMILIVALMLTFAIMTGLSPSVVRATVMFTLLSVTAIIERESSPVNSLCIAAVVILCFNPLALFMLGFQLSFMAMAAILTFLPTVDSLAPKNPILKMLWDYSAMTTVVVICTGALVALHFGWLPVWFLPANIAGSFLLPPILGGGVLLVLLERLALPSGWLAGAIDWLYTGLCSVARLCASLPCATIEFGPSHAPWLILFMIMTVMVGGYVVTRRKPWLLAAYVVFTAGAAIILLIPTEVFPNTEMIVTGSNEETTVLIRQGNRMQAFSTVTPGQTFRIREAAEERYKAYMQRRGVDSIPVTHIGGNMSLTLGGKSVSIVRRYPSAPDTANHTHWLVLCSGLKGDVVAMAKGIRPDSVVLSSDLHPALHTRWMSELSEAGFAVRSLKNSPLRVADVEDND